MFDCLLQLAPQKALSLICGKLLGDGNLTNEKNRQPRLRFQHCYSDHEWCTHCYNSLKLFIPLSPPKKRTTSDPRLTKGYSESIYVQSKTTPLFVSLKRLWYQKNKKVIPFEFLSMVFDEAGLAWWYQDDGHLKIDDNKVRKIILSTDNFSMEENEKLIALLKQKFKLSFSLDGQNRLCLYDQVQIIYFLHIIHPYIHFSMSRKIYNNKINLSKIPIKKRTTISLPSFVSIISPTKDINRIVDKIDPDAVVKNWFNNFDPNVLKLDSKFKNKYQIVLNKEQLLKLENINSRTGLKMNEIVYLGFIS